MSARDARLVVFATWLIGLGTVFLVQRSAGWTWNEAWPMFIVLVGVAAFVEAAVARRGRRSSVARIWDFTWSVAWTAAGLVLLASTTRVLSEGPLEIVDQSWPWVAIALGGWFVLGALVTRGSGPSETYARPLDDLSEAEVAVKFGAGELEVHPAAAGSLVDGTFQGGVVVREPRPGRIEIAQDLDFAIPWVDHPAAWSLGLATGVPLHLRFDTGACRARLDLTDLAVRSLELHSGASQTTVRLPKAAGLTTVRAETGAAELVLDVPDGVAARIRGRMALGSTVVDETRFPRATDGSYVSPDFATAVNRVEIDAQGGLGAVRVVSSPEVAAAA